MTRTTLKARQWQVRQEAILDAARELLIERGYAQMSMDDVAAQIGISKATLYQHFASKDELAIQVTVQMMERSHDDMAALDPALPAIVRLERILRGAIERRAQWWANAAGLPASVIAQDTYQSAYTRMIDTTRALIDTAKAQRDIRPELSTAVIAGMIGRLFQADYNDLITSGQSTSAELRDTLIAILFNGIRSSNQNNPNNEEPL